jgi:RND family efflux transporter MFP subunit
MKKILMLGMLAVLAFACSQPDKKQQLDELKKKQQEIAGQIDLLEAELKADGSDASSKDSKPVEISTVSISNFDHFIEIQGTVKADDEVIVPSETGGSIVRIFVTEGDFVKAGQILAELDSEILKKSLDEIKTGYEMANTVYERQKRLWDQQVGSEIQFLQAKSNKESLENRMATVQEQIDKTRIKSPISGSVESVPVKVGQMTAPGSPVAMVVNFSKVKVEAELAESYSSKVKVGNMVVVHFPDVNEDIQSKISFTGKFINPVNRTFTIEVPLTQSKVEYRVNMVAVVKINDYKNEAAISVPVNVIQNSKSGKYVFLAKASGSNFVASKQVVELGQIYDGMAEITSGLSAGDKIISQGYQMVNDGQIVTFVQ